MQFLINATVNIDTCKKKNAHYFLLVKRERALQFEPWFLSRLAVW